MQPSEQPPAASERPWCPSGEPAAWGLSVGSRLTEYGGTKRVEVSSIRDGYVYVRDLPEERPAANVMESLSIEIGRAIRLVEDARLEIAMHPDDVTDEVRQKVAVVPLTTLRETRLVSPGKAYLIRPGAIR